MARAEQLLSELILPCPPSQDVHHMTAGEYPPLRFYIKLIYLKRIKSVFNYCSIQVMTTEKEQWMQPPLMQKGLIHNTFL